MHRLNLHPDRADQGEAQTSRPGQARTQDAHRGGRRDHGQLRRPRSSPTVRLVGEHVPVSRLDSHEQTDANPSKQFPAFESPRDAPTSTHYALRTDSRYHAWSQECCPPKFFFIRHVNMETRRWREDMRTFLKTRIITRRPTTMIHRVVAEFFSSIHIRLHHRRIHDVLRKSVEVMTLLEKLDGQQRRVFTFTGPHTYSKTAKLIIESSCECRHQFSDLRVREAESSY